MVFETKGFGSQQNQTKREYLNEWNKAVNNQGGYCKRRKKSNFIQVKFKGYKYIHRIHFLDWIES